MRVRRRMLTVLKIGLTVGVLTSVWLFVPEEQGGGGYTDAALDVVGKYVDLSLLGLAKTKSNQNYARNFPTDELKQERSKENARLAERKTREEARLAEEQRRKEEQDRQKRKQEAWVAEEKRKEEEAQLAESKRKAEEAQIVEQKRKAEEARVAEEKRKQEEARVAEEKRKQEEAQVAEEKRKQEEARVAEEKRKQEEARVAEEKRKQEEARVAEEKRKQEEARVAEEKRKQEEARVAEAKRKAEEARIVEQKRKAEEARVAEEKRKQVEGRVAEEKKKQEEARLSEEKRKQEARVAEENRNQEKRKQEEKIKEQDRLDAKNLEEQKKREAAIQQAKLNAEKARQKQKEEQERAQEERRQEQLRRIANIKNVNQEKMADDARRQDEYGKAEAEVEQFSESQAAGSSDGSNTDVHIAVVACGDRMPETVILLKSARMLSRVHLHFHVFAEEELKPKFTEAFEAWPENVKKHTTFDVQSLAFPPENAAEWKKLFKTCASQRLFLPDLLPKLDAVLYLDTDILFMRPPEDIWRFFRRFNSSQIAALAPEHEDAHVGWYNRFARHPFYPPLGVNSGVMLMNLTRMRAVKWVSAMIPYHKEYKYRITWGDQDLINIYFHFKPEMLYVYPCHWNFRPDHCMYMSICQQANENGANLVHGNRRVWFEDKQPAFKALYQAFEVHKFGDGLNELLRRLITNMSSTAVINTNCGKVSDAMIGQLKKQITLFNNHKKQTSKINKAGGKR